MMQDWSNSEFLDGGKLYDRFDSQLPVQVKFACAGGRSWVEAPVGSHLAESAGAGPH